MALGNQFKTDELGGSAFAATYTTEQYPLGTLAIQQADEVVAANSTHEGDRVWVFVKATGALSANKVVARVVGASAWAGTTAGASSTYQEVLGVADHAIAINSYGWIIRRGCCEVTADGSSTQAVDQMTVASGEVSDMTSGLEARVIGNALDTDTGSSTVISMYLGLA